MLGGALQSPHQKDRLQHLEAHPCSPLYSSWHGLWRSILISFIYFSLFFSFLFFFFFNFLFIYLFLLMNCNVCALGNGFVLHYMHRMPWFTHRILVLPLFIIPNAFGQTAAHFLYYKYPEDQTTKHFLLILLFCLIFFFLFFFFVFINIYT